MLLALLKLLLAINELLELYSQGSFFIKAEAAPESSASCLLFGGSAASWEGRLLMLVSMIELIKRAFTSRSAIVFSHVRFTLWAVRELVVKPIRRRALGALLRRTDRSHKARMHRHSSGAYDAEPDGNHVDDDEVLLRREAAKLLIDVFFYTLVTASSDADARVQLRFSAGSTRLVRRRTPLVPTEIFTRRSPSCTLLSNLHRPLPCMCSKCRVLCSDLWFSYNCIPN